MILICLAINPVGDCSEMAVLGFRSSLLVIIISIIHSVQATVQLHEYLRNIPICHESWDIAKQ